MIAEPGTRKSHRIAVRTAGGCERAAIDHIRRGVSPLNFRVISHADHRRKLVRQQPRDSADYRRSSLRVRHSQTRRNPHFWQTYSGSQHLLDGPAPSLVKGEPAFSPTSDNSQGAPRAAGHTLLGRSRTRIGGFRVPHRCWRQSLSPARRQPPTGAAAGASAGLFQAAGFAELHGHPSARETVPHDVTGAGRALADVDTTIPSIAALARLMAVQQAQYFSHNQTVRVQLRGIMP